jgi:hypothetical protein
VDGADEALGYTKHVAQGGDWGALTTQIMAPAFIAIRYQHVVVTKGNRPRQRWSGAANVLFQE